MKEKLILIGASAGGPGHLKVLLKDLPKELKTPIFIAQHMNVIFIPSFVQQLKTELNAHVNMVSSSLDIKQGGIYICKKNSVFKHGCSLEISTKDAPSNTLYNPNIDALFLSGVHLCKEREVLAILLTGIGNDGALGLKALHEAGAKCFGENEKSAVVYGMPKKAKELNPELKMLSLLEIKSQMQRFLNVFF